VDSFSGASGTVFIDPGAKITKPGTTDDLSEMHPIGFRYRQALYLADQGLKSPDSVNSDPDIELEDWQGVNIGGVVSCASCHDVHDTKDLGPNGSLLVKDNMGSTLCLTCHNK
jgi:predicted CXXCH cytochrome family protein